jgi:integrase
LVTPAALSPTGKRRQKAFRTEKEARAALKQAEAARAALGTNMRHVITDMGEQAQWMRDRGVAASAGLSTSSAIAFAAQCVAEFGGIDKALELARWAKGRAMQAWPDISLADAFVEYREACSDLSKVTQARRLYAHNRFMRYTFEACMNTYLHQLTPQVASDILGQMDLTPLVWNQLVKELKSLCSWAQSRGYIDPDRHPLRGLKLRQVKEQEIKCLTPSELSHLLRTACHNGRRREALHVVLGAFAGIRPNECRRLTWDAVGIEDDFISVRAKHSKTGGTRHINLRPVLRAWLDYLSPPASRNPADLITGGVGAGSIGDLHREAGWKKWPQDVLRHSFASYALKAGTSLSDLQTDMGHVSLALLKTRYLNMTGLTAASAREWWQLTPERVLDPEHFGRLFQHGNPHRNDLPAWAPCCHVVDGKCAKNVFCPFPW